MGKITVQGYAERKVNYDLVTLSVIFRAREKTSSRASEEVVQQCDSFLQAICEKGVQLEEIHFEEDSIGQAYQDRENITISAERRIQVTVPFNMNFMNFIMELIQKHVGDIEYRTEFSLSNSENIHKELLQESVLNARKNAELIAEALGQKVIALKSVTPGRAGVAAKFLDYMSLSDEINYCNTEHIADVLDAPTTTESENVESVWLLE